MCINNRCGNSSFLFVEEHCLGNFKSVFLLFLEIHLQWVLSPKYFNFPFPITLTMVHMGFSGLVAFFLVRVFKVFISIKSFCSNNFLVLLVFIVITCTIIRSMESFVSSLLLFVQCLMSSILYSQLNCVKCVPTRKLHLNSILVSTLSS